MQYTPNKAIVGTLGINMDEARLKELIDKRGFDTYQSGLISRFSSEATKRGNIVYLEQV